MIVDAHTHIWHKDWRTPWNEEGTNRTIIQRLGVSMEEARKIQEDKWDPMGDKLVAEMDRNGVDVSVVLRNDYGLVVPGAGNDHKVPLEEQCRLTAQAVQRHKGRLIWGAGVDPRRPSALKLLDLCLGQLGAKVIKLYPPAGFYPNEKIVYRIYEKAIQFGVPVEFHTMPVAIVPMRNKFSHPLHLEDVAMDFPELKIIATHAGGPFWWRDMLAAARGKDNMYLNVAAWLHVLRRTPLECYRAIREMMDLVGPGRLMWGTDWPSTLPQESVQGPWLKAFQEIPPEVKEAGMKFTDKELAAFLGGTAADLYDLDAGV
jgi:predicted TIM-barrel fold metal-dependent hydrolase